MVWNSIRVGASSADISISSSMLTMSRTGPPYCRASLSSRITLASFGRNSSVAVAENSASAFSGCHSGQVGNNWYGCVKYSGGTSACLASAAVDSSRNRNQSGADR
ncbi:hypothetical protein D3C71_1866270 [compost metagenome]